MLSWCWVGRGEVEWREVGWGEMGRGGMCFGRTSAKCHKRVGEPASTRRYLLLTTDYSLLTIYYLLLTTHYLQLTTYSLLDACFDSAAVMIVCRMLARQPFAYCSSCGSPCTHGARKALRHMAKTRKSWVAQT